MRHTNPCLSLSYAQEQESTPFCSRCERKGICWLPRMSLAAALLHGLLKIRDIRLIIFLFLGSLPCSSQLSMCVDFIKSKHIGHYVKTWERGFLGCSTPPWNAPPLRLDGSRHGNYFSTKSMHAYLLKPLGPEDRCQHRFECNAFNVLIISCYVFTLL